MSIIFPANRKEVSDRMKTDVQANLPAANPFLKNSYLGALITGFAGRVYDFYLQLQVLIKEIFPNTADGVYLQMWGELVGITRNSATSADGLITLLGTAGTVVPFNTALTSSSGEVYSTQAAVTVANQSVVISSLTRSGTVATAVTVGNHNFASGITATIAGANETQYNGAQVITTTGLNSFTYTVAGSPASPATTGASLTAATTSAAVQVVSTDAGFANNLASGEQLTISSPIAGLNNTAYVQFGQVAGGTDQETDAALRARIIDRYANPVSLFNDAAISTQAKKVAGVTRVFIQDITPYVGAVTVYFTRDGDGNIIPTSSEVTDVYNKLLLIKPASMLPTDLVVAAPLPVVVDFAFSSLVPNTPTMQAAVKANLTVLFQEGTVVGQDLLALAYNAAIFQTVDPVTGAEIQSFTLSAPSGDVDVDDGYLPVLGVVTFS